MLSAPERVAFPMATPRTSTASGSGGGSVMTTSPVSTPVTPTGASVAMQILRRQAQVGAGIAVVGFVLVFFGFFLK
jgi:hypothetical protein